MLSAYQCEYICGRCRWQGQQILRVRTPKPTFTANIAPGAPGWHTLQKRPASSRRANPDRLGHDKIPTGPSPQTSPVSLSQSLPIRERLRLWELENCLPPGVAPNDAGLALNVVNKWIKLQSTGLSDLEGIGDPKTFSDVSNSFIDDDPMSVSQDSKCPGDLVELRSYDSQAPILAVFLGFFGSRNHFYASNGRWVFTPAYASLFAVSNFVSVDQIRPILAKIPKDGTPEIFEEMRLSDAGPSREEGRSVIQQLTQFRLDTERVYQKNLSRLDSAHAFLADTKEPKYLSLFEMADVLLLHKARSDEGHPTSALYAVHLALMRAEFGFLPLNPSRYCHRRDHIFELAPIRQVELVNWVATITRAYIESRIKRLGDPEPSQLGGTPLGDFILKAREVVLRSRSRVDPSSSMSWGVSGRASFDPKEWSSSDRDIISFLDLWSSFNLFSSGSRFQTYGSTILGAIGLYKDLPLDFGTAWLFLQEIGVIPSWEIPTRYRARFPKTTIVRGGGLTRDSPGNVAESKRQDIAVHERKDWAAVPVFCIDAPSTRVIDDGISLERTREFGEFWIHVHVADPASVLSPNSRLRGFLELIPETIYLPGHYQPMLPENGVDDDAIGSESANLVEEFSLRVGAPVLTFSAKVNGKGEMLEYKVEPGVIHNVKYLDPDDVSRFCNEPSPPSAHSEFLAVGQRPKAEAETTGGGQRSITLTEALDDSEKRDILELYQLVEAVKQRRLSKGAWPYFFPTPSVSVRFHEDATNKLTAEAAPVALCDPYIEVRYGNSMGCSVVSNSMVLAGEIAAKWCASRGIPIPFRRNVNVANNYSEALAYATSELYPLIERGIEPTAAQREELTRWTGAVEIAAEPGPYFLLGLDMYAKATSPLRRFADMIVHWQIHAALAHERRVGRRLDPAVDSVDEIVPFSIVDLEKALPLLETREKMCRLVGRGIKDWILQALMRDHHGSSDTKVFRFTVDVRRHGGLVGHLDYFGLNAILEVAQLNGLVLMRSVKIGDQFDVTLDSINLRTQDIRVKALKYLGDTVDDEKAGGSTQFPPSASILRSGSTQHYTPQRGLDKATCMS